MKKYLILLLCLNFIFAKAQDCNCKMAFAELVEVAENDYAGFDYKMKTKGSKAYKKIKRSTFRKAKKAKDLKTCEQVFINYINFFTDKHLNIITSDFNEHLNANDLPPSFYYDEKNNISYLKIPSFSFTFKASIDSLVMVHEMDIKHSAIFIIDISNNEGGSDASYEKLSPFIYTNPYEMEGADFKSTAGNIAELESYLEYKDMFDEATLSEIKNLVKKLKTNKGQFINGSPPQKITLDTYFSELQNVAIIITNAKSAAEGLILDAQQSTKVKLFGQNSGGARDFMNVRHHHLKSCNVTVGLPMSKSTRVPEKGIDDVGIPPQVRYDFDDDIGKTIQFIKSQYSDLPSPPKIIQRKLDNAVFTENRIYVDFKTKNGEKVKFYTDSGGGKIIQPSAIEKFGLETKKVEEGENTFELVRLDSICEANNTPKLEGPLFVYTGENHFKESEGMLGAQWFGNKIWNFDYINKTLSVVHRVDWSKHDKKHTVDLGYMENEEGQHLTHFPRIPIVVEGETIQTLFDTGASIFLSDEGKKQTGDEVIGGCFIIADIFDKWRAEHPDWRFIAKGDALIKEDIIEVPKVTIAGHEVGPVWFARRKNHNFTEYMSQWMDKPISGAVGGSLFQYFGTILIDYPKEKVFFEK